MTEAVRAGAMTVVGLATVIVAARRARALRRRSAVIGRVSGAAPPDARRARSISQMLQEPPHRVVAELRALELPIEPALLWRCWIGSVAFGFGFGALIAGPVLGLLGGATVAVAPLIASVMLRSRADAAYDTTLATALDAVGRSVRSGGSLPQAVSEASIGVRGPVGADLSRVATAIGRGRPFADAVRDWRDARDKPSVRLTVGALVLATQTGGPPARVIEDVASAIRSRQQVAREAHALAAQARLSALVVGVAPLGFMVITCLADPRNAHVLFGTPVGITCVLAGLGLDALGAMWMHRLSKSVAS